MSDEKKQEMETHVYDGIVELDHPIPGWFSMLFVGTILFGIGYFGYYELGNGPGLFTEYERQVRDHAYAQYLKDPGGNGPKLPGEVELVAFSKEPERVKAGRAVFDSKCVSCHGKAGEGGIGPNLTDNYWLHGGKLSDIIKVVSEGVPAKGMPPWGPVLSEKDLQSVVAFIGSIRGSNPPGAKAPQGEKVD